MDWKGLFEKGKASFKASQFEEALDYFTKSLTLQPDQFVIYDSRAAVYEKLGNPKAALRDSKSVIDIAPQQWQGYARSARLFLNAQKLDSALKMVNLALDRIKTDDAKRCVDLEGLKAQVLEVREINRLLASRSINHATKLPIELLVGIFAEVVASECWRVLVLGGVCWQWRWILLQTPSMWRELVLTAQRPVLKARTWATRSKGTIVGLRIRSGAENSIFAIFDELGQQTLKRVRIFDVTDCGPSFLKSPCMPHIGANLEHLHIWSRDYCQWGTRVLSNFTGGNLRSLYLRHASFAWSELSDYFNALTSLEIEESIVEGSLVILLATNPLLERVVISSPVYKQSPLDNVYRGEQISLASLTHLSLGAQFPFLEICQLVKLPSLQALYLFSVGDLEQALPVLIKQDVSMLTSLKIKRSPVQANTLVRFLKAIPLLETLEITELLNVADTVLEALMNPVSLGSSGSGEPRLPMCPNLMHLNLSRCTDIKTGPLIRLVKARTAETAELHSLACLETLFVNGCPSVESNSLPWLRSKVPNFECVYMDKKEAKGRLL